MKKSFLKYLNALTLVGIMASLVVFTSCSDDDDAAPAATQSVWEIVQSTSNLASLEAELEAAELDGALADADAQLTLFAPTDAALSTLLGTLGLTDFSTVNPAIANGVLTYHVLAEIVNSSDLAEGNTYTTLQGEQVTVAGGPTLVSGATSPAGFQVTDIQATNGVVHIIDVVLVPPSTGGAIIATLGTVAQPVLLGADFSILAAGIQKADAGKPAAETLLGALIGAQDLTVFAPTNATFNAAQVTVDALTAAQWDAYIRNHVVVGQGGGTDDNINTLGPNDLTTGASYTTLGGGELLFFNNTDAIPAANGIGIFIDSNGDVNLADQTTYGGFNAEVALPDAVSASNGRIHVIAGILAPATPPTEQ